MKKGNGKVAKDGIVLGFVALFRACQKFGGSRNVYLDVDTASVFQGQENEAQEGTLFGEC
jgi:hypothetical protein